MERIAFKMKLKPGSKSEYQKRHDEIWPELKELISQNGISDYSIFFDEQTDTLFAVQQKAGNLSAPDLGQLEIVKKWWHHMADIMETHPDHSPVVHPLELMFHMD